VAYFNTVTKHYCKYLSKPNFTRWDAIHFIHGFTTTNIHISGSFLFLSHHRPNIPQLDLPPYSLAVNRNGKPERQENDGH
jgi:hypothetical protein